VSQTRLPQLLSLAFADLNATQPNLAGGSLFDGSGTATGNCPTASSVCHFRKLRRTVVAYNGAALHCNCDGVCRAYLCPAAVAASELSHAPRNVVNVSLLSQTNNSGFVDQPGRSADERNVANHRFDAPILFLSETVVSFFVAEAICELLRRLRPICEHDAKRSIWPTKLVAVSFEHSWIRRRGLKRISLILSLKALKTHTSNIYLLRGNRLSQARCFLSAVATAGLDLPKGVMAWVPPNWVRFAISAWSCQEPASLRCCRRLGVSPRSQWTCLHPQG